MLFVFKLLFIIVFQFVITQNSLYTYLSAEMDVKSTIDSPKPWNVNIIYDYQKYLFREDHFPTNITQYYIPILVR